jgi:serine phosphatase RsbU (regulator of sigma subunit)
LYPKRPVAEVVAGIRQEIAAHAQGHPQSDDITMLALRFLGTDSDSRQ